MAGGVRDQVREALEGHDVAVADEPQMPFGGVKGSGFGRFGGTAAINEFTDVHWVTVRSGAHPFPF